MLADTEARILILLLDLHILDSQSLKDKRRVIRSIKERLRSRFNISVAEVGAQDKWQRAILGISKVGNDGRQLDADARQIVALIESRGQVEILSSGIDIL